MPKEWEVTIAHDEDGRPSGVWVEVYAEEHASILLSDHEARALIRELKDAALVVEGANKRTPERDYPLTADPQ